MSEVRSSYFIVLMWEILEWRVSCTYYIVPLLFEECVNFLFTAQRNEESFHDVILDYGIFLENGLF